MSVFLEQTAQIEQSEAERERERDGIKIAKKRETDKTAKIKEIYDYLDSANQLNS